MADDFIPYSEIQAGVAEPEVKTETETPDFIPYPELQKPNRVLYDTSKDKTYSYPGAMDDDEVNEAAQTELQGKEGGDFFLATPVNKAIGVADKGIDLLESVGKGAVAFGVSASLRTIGGDLLIKGEVGEQNKPAILRAADILKGASNPFIMAKEQLKLAKNMFTPERQVTEADKALADIGISMIQKSNEILSNEFFETEGVAEKVAFDIGGAGASLFTALGLTWATGSPEAASILFGEIAKTDKYIQARIEGKSPEDSLVAGWQAFVVEGGLEYMGLDAFTQTMRGSKTLTRIGFKMATEFVQEFSQELGGNIVSKINSMETGDWHDILMQSLYSGAIGFITGGAGGGVQVMKENRGLIGEWRKAGFTDEEIDIVMPVLAKAEAAQQNIQKMYVNKLTQQYSRVQDQKYIRGKEPLTDKEKSGKMDPKVRRAMKAKTLSETDQGGRPTDIADPTTEAVPGANNAVKGRINQLDTENADLETERAELEAEQERRETPAVLLEEKDILPKDKAKGKGVTEKNVAKSLKGRPMVGETDKKIQKRIDQIDDEIFNRDVEKLGLELGPLFSAEGAEPGARVKVSLKAGVLAHAQNLAMRRQLQKFREGLKAGKKTTKAQIRTLQRYVMATINASEVLTDTQKKRMLKSIPKVNTQRSFEKQISALETQIAQLETINLKKIFTDAAYNVLKRAGNAKNMDADTKKLFDKLIALSKEPGSDPEVFQKEFDADNLEAVFKFDVATLDSPYASLDVLKQIYFDLQGLMNEGINNLKAEKKSLKEAKAKSKEEITKDITGDKKALKYDINNQKQIKKKKGVKRTWFTGDLSLFSRIKILSRNSKEVMGKSFIENFFDTFKARQVYETVYQAFGPRIKEATERIYGLKNLREVQEKWFKDMAEDHIVFWEVPIAGTGEVDPDTGQIIEGTEEMETRSAHLTRAELRKRWMEWQRAAGRKTLTAQHGYTEDTILAMQDILTPQDMEFINEQFAIYSELYELMSPLYKHLTGKNLPFESFYSHLFTLGQQDPRSSAVDVMAAQGAQGGFFDRSLTEDDMFKHATGGSSGVRDVADIFAIEKYIRDVSYFMGYAEFTANMDNFLKKDKDIRANIEYHFGEQMLAGIDFEVKRLLQGGVDYESNPSFKWLQDFTTPVVKAYLSNPVVGVKQLVSAFAYISEMPSFNFIEGMLDFPRAYASGDIKKLISTVFIQARRGDTTFEREMKIAKQLAEDSGAIFGAGRKISITDAMLQFMRMGDRGAMYFGGWAMYKYNTEVLKMSEQEALDHFVEFSRTTQQSSDVDQLPPVLSSRNAAVRLLTLFKQARYQYMNAMRVAIANRHRKGASPIQTAKRVVVMHSVLPMLFQFIASGFRFDMPEQLRAAVLGHFNDLVLIGGAIENTVSWVLNKVWDEYEPNWRNDSNMVDSMAKSFKKTMEGVAELMDAGSLDAEDTFDLIKEFATAVAPIGGTVSGAARYAATIGRGATRILDGEYIDGLKNMAGYSNYIVEKE